MCCVDFRGPCGQSEDTLVAVRARQVESAHKENLLKIRMVSSWNGIPWKVSDFFVLGAVSDIKCLNQVRMMKSRDSGLSCYINLFWGSCLHPPPPGFAPFPQIFLFNWFGVGADIRFFSLKLPG